MTDSRQNKTNIYERLLADREVQNKLSISRVTLYRLRKKGLLRARRLGGRNVYLLTEIEAFMASLPLSESVDPT